MASLLQGAVRAVLREGGPLTVDEVLTRVLARQPVATKNPRNTVNTLLVGDPLCLRRGDGRYVFLPAVLRGACLRVSMEGAVPAKGLLVAGAEVFACLWPVVLWGDPALVPRLALEGGPAVALDGERAMPGGLYTVTRLPAAFWRWWAGQQATGADALLLRCDDGETARFSVRGLATRGLDTAAVATRNAQVREAAVAIVRRTHGLRADDLARRLLAQGVYHGEPAPDPLPTVLLDPHGPVTVEQGVVRYRAELTPAVRRLFGPRLQQEWLWDTVQVRELVGHLPLLEMELEPEPPPRPALTAPTRTPQGIRLKVSLQWNRRVWRVLELLEQHTLEDLHVAIQQAFGWGNDHPYAFFLSGRAWDSVTAVAGPFDEEAEPPIAHEVELAALELQPRQRFLYIFDFGDDLRHDIEVLAPFSTATTAGFPRVVESHGIAPPQYAVWPDDAEDDNAPEE